MLTLKKGDGIAVFSPSFPATALAKERYNRGKQYLIEKGFNFIEGDLVGKSDIYRSGTIQERADEFNALLHNPEVKCMIAATGGSTANSILPYIDYDYLKENPKIIVGFSDITSLLLGIYAKTGVITYYGPSLVGGFGEFAPLVDETYAYFEAMVCQKPMFPYNFPTPKAWTDEEINWNKQDRAKTLYDNELVTVNHGKAVGRLIGGTLNTMIMSVWGSEYMPTIQKGDILFIEDYNKTIGIEERLFTNLKLNGVFDKIGGLILGKHAQFKDEGTGRKPYEVLLEVIGTPTFPILAEFDCGHAHPMLTVPIGGIVGLDATNKRVTLIKV